MNGTVRTYRTPARVGRVSQQQWGAPPPPQQWGAPPQPQSGGTWSQGRAPWQGGNAGWSGQTYASGPTQQRGTAQYPQAQWQAPGGSWQQAPSGWQAPGGGWPPPPRRQRSGFGTLIKIVLAVIGLLVLFSLANSVLNGLVSGGGAAPLPQNSGEPNYQNEGYVPPAVSETPPAVPGPRNLDAAERLVTANPLYDQTVPVPTNCRMSNTKPLQQMSASEKEAHFNEQVACLMTVWINPVEDAGFELPRPQVYVYTSPIKTACGDFDTVNAAYCTADQRIYYSDELLDSLSTEAANGAYAGELVLAHEFGHAVQARTAILISERVLESETTTKAASQELSRRIEVQADCFAGAYVQSVTRSQNLTASDLANLKQVTHSIGDDILSGREGYVGGHGTGAARQNWFTRGLGDAQVGVCNSFTAPSDEVR